MENKNLENLFRKRLAGMVIEPSAQANEAFEGRLKRRQQRILYRRISIAASIILMVMAGAIGFFPGDQEREEIAEQSSVVNKPSNDMVASQDEVLPENNESSIEDMLEDKGAPVAPASKEKSDPPAGKDDPIDTRSSDAGGAHVEKDAYLAENKEMPGTIQVATPSGEPLTAERGPSDISQLPDVTPQEPLIAGEDKEYGEDVLEDNAGYNGPEQTKPVKITIEYIAAGSNDQKSRTRLREFYSKMDNLKGVDEVLGDFREYKDRLFALEFRNDNKVKNEK